MKIIKTVCKKNLVDNYLKFAVWVFFFQHFHSVFPIIFVFSSTQTLFGNEAKNISCKQLYNTLPHF